MDDFAQTREDDDLFTSEISVPQHPPPTVPTEPRAFSNRGGRSSRTGRGFYQARSDREKSPPVEGTATAEALTKQVVDRTLSGGIKKPKLTEDELAARLERVKLNNERLIERRRKAEEDESSFQVAEEARKKADANKRTAERRKRSEADKNRKELDDERERNRQRKLKAVQTREWDSTKTEEDYNPRGQSSRFRRGAHGGVSVASPPRGAPSGPRAGVNSLAKAQEWPGLPDAGKGKEKGKGREDGQEGGEGKGNEKNPVTDTAAQKGKLTPSSPAVGGSSWAEQVEAGSPVVTTTAAAPG